MLLGRGTEKLCSPRPGKSSRGQGFARGIPDEEETEVKLLLVSPHAWNWRCEKLYDRYHEPCRNLGDYLDNSFDAFLSVFLKICVKASFRSSSLQWGESCNMDLYCLN